jgi:histidyl-tRNA synthetase
LFFNLGVDESAKAYELMQQLRSRNVRSEIFHEQQKMDKQFRYAEKKNIRYVVIIGSREAASGTCTIKNLETGKQQEISFRELLDFSFE